MSPARPLAALPLLVMLVGCVSARVESVVDRTRSYDVRDVTVLITGPREELSKDLGERVVDRLTARGVRSGAWVLPDQRSAKLTLEDHGGPGPIEKAIGEAQRPYVLVVVLRKVQAELYGLSSSRAYGVDLELALISKELGKAIWKSTLSAEKPRGSPGGESVLLDSIADKVTDQLALDGLVGPPAKVVAKEE